MGAHLLAWTGSRAGRCTSSSTGASRFELVPFVFAALSALGKVEAVITMSTVRAGRGGHAPWAPGGESGGAQLVCTSAAPAEVRCHQPAWWMEFLWGHDSRLHSRAGLQHVPEG